MFADRPKKLQDDPELAEQNKESHFVCNCSIKNTENVVVPQRTSPESAVDTFCGLCDLDYGEPHLVAQSQREGTTKQCCNREKIGNERAEKIRKRT